VQCPVALDMQAAEIHSIPILYTTATRKAFGAEGRLLDNNVGCYTPRDLRETSKHGVEKGLFFLAVMMQHILTCRAP
jgi:hypothetical protein